MKSRALYPKSATVLLLLAALLTGCCLIPNRDEPIPDPPEEIQQRIDLKQHEMDAVRAKKISTENRSNKELEEEIAKRKARIAFLQSEINALLKLKSESIRYYQTRPRR